MTSRLLAGCAAVTLCATSLAAPGQPCAAADSRLEQT